jgi:hypothetical protein
MCLNDVIKRLFELFAAHLLYIASVLLTTLSQGVSSIDCLLSKHPAQSWSYKPRGTLHYTK